MARPSVLSRKKLDDLTTNFKGELVRFSGNQVRLTELTQALESQSLFDQSRLVLVENLFGRRPSQEKETILNYLKKNQPQNLLIWEGKKIDGRVLTAFLKARIQRFDLTPFIFQLVDSLTPNQPKKSLNLLKLCLKQDSGEMVFYMLARQVKLLLIAKDLGTEGLKRMASWQQNKLLNQAKNFTFPQLLKLHQSLLKIDYQQKTGRTPFSLASQLDLLIASL